MSSNLNNILNDYYVNYHLSICEREDLIGYSGHVLSIVRKRG